MLWSPRHVVWKGVLAVELLLLCHNLSQTLIALLVEGGLRRLIRVEDAGGATDGILDSPCGGASPR